MKNRSLSPLGASLLAFVSLLLCSASLLAQTFVPVITSPGTATGQVGVPFTYQITATNSPASYGTGVLPTGLSTDIPTGLISGTPTVAGTFNILLAAANAAGTGDGTLVLTIAPAFVPTLPAIAIVSPPDKITVVVGVPVPLAASVIDPDGVLAQVQFFVNGLLVGTTGATGANGKYTISVPAPAPGTYVLTAVATDTLGRPSNSNTVTVVAVAPDANNPAPSANLLTPLDGRQVAAGATIVLSATASSPTTAGLDHVNIYLDGTVIASFDAAGNLLNAAPHSGPGTPTRRDASMTPLSGLFTTSYTLPGLDKILTMLVTATDKLGNTSVSGVATFHAVVTADRAPLVAFSNLGPTAQVPVGTDTVADVSASDPDAATSSAGAGPVRQDGTVSGLIAEMEYFLNGVSQQGALLPPYNFSFTPPTAGKYLLHAVATDGAGLATVSDPVVVEVGAMVNLAAGGTGIAVEGGAKGIVLVTRTGDTAAPLTVSYKAKGSAKAGVDYKPLSGTATIPAGSSKTKIKIKPIDGSPNAGLLKVKLVLLPSSDGSYVVGTSPAKIKILGD